MRRTTKLFVPLIAVAALVLAACGDDDDSAALGTQANPRTIEVDMLDIEFSPDRVSVEDGETVRFVFTNKGAIIHDAFIGDAAAQDGHAMEMTDMDDMGHGMGHDDADDDALTVMPGETGEFTHTFQAGDMLLVGCHQPGHYEAGMIMTIEVS